MKGRAIERDAAGSAAAGGGGRFGTLRFSIGLRRCCACSKLVGLRLWPWSGQLVVETHGYCRRCAAQLLD